MEFKLLDKVVHEFVDYNKPYEYYEYSIPKGASGCAPQPKPNSKIEGLICEIETVNRLCYNFTSPCDDDCLPIGEYKMTETFYYILGCDERFTWRDLKKID